MNERSTTVVLLNWNGWRDTVACVESLLHLRGQSPRVVVCDNASADDSWQQICKWCERHIPGEYGIVAAEEASAFPRVALIQTGSNLGFAGGCNVGICYALRDPDCAYVWLLNNDTVVDADALQQQVKMLRGDTSIGLLGSTLVYYDQPSTVQCFGGYRFNFWTGRVRPFCPAGDLQHPPTTQQAEAQLRYVSGASTLTTRRFVEDVGLLNEQYFLYFEEVDWATRGRKYRLSYCPASVVQHKEGRSIGSAASAGSRSVQSERWLSRNRVLFTRTYFPLRVPVVLLWMFCVVLVRFVRGNFAIAKAMLGGGLQGCVAPIIPPPRLPHPISAEAAKAAA